MKDASVDKHVHNCACLSGGITANLHSGFRNSQSVNHLISQIQTMKTTEELSSGFSLETNSTQDTGGLDESSDSLNQVEDHR